MKLQKKLGATSEIWQIFIADSSSTTGAGLTGLAFNTASLVAYFHRDTDTTATAITLVTMTVGTFTSSGFKEIDATNMPGWYQLCPPNTVCATGAKSVAVHLKGATNMAPLPMEVQLTAFDVDDVVRGGLTAIPNAVFDAAGGLFGKTVGAGVTSIGTATAGDVNGATLPSGQRANVRVGHIILVTSGANAGEERTATAVNNTSGVFTVNPAFGSSVASFDYEFFSREARATDTSILPNVNVSDMDVGVLTTGLKKNVALANFPFVMTDATTHAPVTGKTVTATRRLDAGSFSACANSVSEVANGWYSISLAATDLNADTVALRFTATGCDDRNIAVRTQDIGI